MGLALRLRPRVRVGGRNAARLVASSRRRLWKLSSSSKGSLFLRAALTTAAHQPPAPSDTWSGFEFGFEFGFGFGFGLGFGFGFGCRSGFR